MGHHPPSTGFTWPVPPEDLAGEPVLLLEWNDEGRVTVRQEPVAGTSASGDATPNADTSAETAAGSAATAWDALRAPAPEIAEHALTSAGAPDLASPEPAGPMWNPLVRERATWLGIGTLIGIALAASALPDSPPLDPDRAARSRDVSVSQPSTPTSAPPAVERPVPGVTLATSRTGPAARARAVTNRTSNEPPGATRVSPPITHAASGASTTSVASHLPAGAAATRTDTRPSAGVSERSADAAAVLQQVQRYQSALTRLDASATHAAWPDADRDTLVKQFTGLREQRLRLDGCNVSVPDVRATVTCRGVLTYRPRVGDHSTRTTRGTWRFALEREGEQWVIDEVTAPPAAAPR